MRNMITQLFVGSIMLVIIFFYYRTELSPFDYENFDNQVTLFQRFDAELDEAIVQTRFGLIKHYDTINAALNGMHFVTDDFDGQLRNAPSDSINNHLSKLKSSLEQKDDLTQDFKRLNPVLRNAISDFSKLMARIIEDEAHLELIESCFEAEYRYSLIDKVNTLFRGVLIYTSSPEEKHRQKMLALIKEIREQPETLPNLDRALIYGDVILKKQPELNALNFEILGVPINEDLEALNEAFKQAYLVYNEKLEQSRFFLYGLSILLLIVLHFAFKRLQDMVKRLQIEIVLKNKAQAELAEINKELEQRVADRTRDLAEKNEDLNKALGELEEAQDQLIMQEKMASVGMLTTGVAHEIKNPLNFINNFSDISVDLVDELKEELEDQKDKLGEETMDYLTEVLDDLKTNCSKISHHGSRADNIVKNMLMHSEETGVQKEMTDIHELIDDNINVSFQTFKSVNEAFECDIQRDFQPDLGEVYVIPQAMGRVFLYLLNNCFFAVEEKFKADPSFKAIVKVTTKKEADFVYITFWDNGTGIPESDFKKIFEPFYTTKPTGMGNTGLGLSICYDTVAKQHKGDLTVASKVGEFTEMTVKLPVKESKSAPKDEDDNDDDEVETQDDKSDNEDNT